MAINSSTDSLSNQPITELVVPPQEATVPSSGDSQINALLSGYRWDNPATISYSFLTGAAAGSYYGAETVSELTGAIINNVRTILETVIEPLINVNFVEVADSASSYGQMRYMFSNLSATNGGYAYARYPYSATDPITGDVHLSPNFETDAGNRFSGNPGNHGYMSLIHETLHALGLKHPGNYNGNGTGEPPFLPISEDNTTNTLMSYNFTGNSAATPMPYDIKALQYIYGAKALNDTSTTYSFSSVSSYTANGQSAGSATTPMKLTIWDSGGIDTLNFSALSSNTSGYRFDLTPGGINTTQSAYNGTSYTGTGDASGTQYRTSSNGTAIAFNTEIENVIGSSSNDIIIGNHIDNTLNGNSGNDSLDGGSGYDILQGDSGNDTLFGGNDHFGQRDTLLGGSGDDTLIATGWHGGDILEGGVGNDTYIVEVYENDFDPPAPTITEVAGAGTDTVKSSSNWTLGANFENLNLEGNGAINGTGNTLGNYLTGNTANNTINGVAGDDQIFGGGGDDSLLGEAGNDLVYDSSGSDTLVGGIGNDTYHVGFYGEATTPDLIVENLNEGTDTVEAYVSYTLVNNLENLTLAGTSAINGTGNALNNSLIGNDANNTIAGNAGNDDIRGGNGNDILKGGSDSLTTNTGNDTLGGGIGSDSMYGQDGNDLYLVENQSDAVIEEVNSGIDTVTSAITYTLGANVEQLNLFGNTAINGTGNTLNNTLTGNGANNSLNGDAGNDTLIGGGGIDTLIGGTGNDSFTGGAGADRLTGGTGKDLFVFKSKTEGRDTVTDFLVVDDTIQVSKLGFGGGLTAGAAITAAQFKLGSAAGDASDRFIYNKANGALLFDADGIGTSASLQFAQLSTNLALTNNDIFVIA